MPDDTGKKRLDLRVPEELYEKLSALAKEDKRKISPYSILVLEEHVARSKPKKKPKSA